MLSIMGVVVGVSAATVLIAERSLRESHESFVRERFRERLAGYARQQATRRDYVLGRARSLAGSVRLLAAMEEGDVDLIYDNARDELREVLADAGEPGAAPGLRASWVRFADPNGRILDPGSDRSSFGPSSIGLGERLARSLAVATRGREPQQVGYLVSRVGDRERAYEIIITRIVDPLDSVTRGAVVLAFDLGRIADEGDDDLTGLLVGDELYLSGLGAERGERLRMQLLRSRSRSGGGPTEVSETAGGSPSLALVGPINVGAAFPPAYRVSLYSLAAALEERAGLRRRILALGALALAAALGVSALLSSSLAKPLRALVDATEQVRAGDLSARVAVAGAGELARLGESFNQMTAGLALKERYRRVLDVVADRRVAERLLSGDLVLGGERKRVTVLFCDIRGFTAMTQDLEPERIVELLNTHMTALTRVVYASNGIVDKFVGDLVMAVFGAPRSSGHDALDAVRCAKRMIAERQRLNATSAKTVSIGIGIATGDVVAGCTGAADRLSYTVLGNHVSLASRLCASAGPMEVLLDENTRAAVGSAMAVATLEPMQLKGFDAPTAVYALRSVVGHEDAA